MSDNKVVSLNDRLSGREIKDVLERLRNVGARPLLIHWFEEASKEHFKRIEKKRYDFDCDGRMDAVSLQLAIGEQIDVPEGLMCCSPMTAQLAILLQERDRHSIANEEQTKQFSNAQLDWLCEKLGTELSEDASISPGMAFLFGALFSQIGLSAEIFTVDDQGHYPSRTYFTLLEDGFGQCDLCALTLYLAPMARTYQKNEVKVVGAIPHKAPVWKQEELQEGVSGHKAALIMTKPSSQFFKGQKPHVWEEIVGTDKEAMERHVQASLDWLARYDAYYNLTGWEYSVRWGAQKGKKARLSSV